MAISLKDMLAARQGVKVVEAKGVSSELTGKTSQVKPNSLSKAFAVRPSTLIVDDVESTNIKAKPSLDLSDFVMDDLAAPAINIVAATPVMPDISNYRYAQQAESAPDEITAGFYTLMHQLVNSFEHADIANHMRSTREYLQTHRHLKEILRPDDIQQMVRALRTSCGNALAARQETRTKKTTKQAAVSDVLDDLGDLVF